MSALFIYRKDRVMTRKEIDENIAIAKRNLKNYQLLVSNNELILDCYLFPSHHYKTYYIQIEKSGGVFCGRCAYTCLTDYFGIKSYSQTFSVIEKADKHTAKSGDTICKALFPDMQFINALIEEAKICEDIDSQSDEIIIDGITAGIRLYNKGSVSKDICLVNLDNVSPLLEMLILFSNQI